jgi:hypothetical protein
MRQNGVSLAFGRYLWPRAWAVLMLVCVPSSCGFHSDVAGLERLRSKIQEQVGTDSAITVHTSEGKSTVTVRLARLPAADPMRVQALVEALAKAEFPKTNYVVVVSTND